MPGTKNPNLPTYGLSEAAVEERQPEVPNASFEGGGNEAASNSPGIGINTGDYNPKPSDWSREERAPQTFGHIGLAPLLAGDIRVDNDMPDEAAFFVQATGSAAPGEKIPGTNAVNNTGVTIPSGAWLWSPDTGDTGTPIDVFMSGQDGFWYDPSDLPTLWTDEAKTTNASAPGQSIWWIDDLSPNENHAKAASEGARGVLYRWPASAVLAGYPRNRLIATDTMATQSVTVLAEQMTVSFKGTGTVTLTGASTAGPLVGTGTADTVSLTFTPTTGSLTLTVSGSVTEAQLEPGAARTTYQSVGAGIWDVTEEGQADCWMIRGDGVTTQYLSSRGIPLFVDGFARVAIAAIKLGNVNGSVLVTNANGGTTNNSVFLFAPLVSDSYGARYRSTANIAANLPATYEPPHTALIDASFDSLEASASIKVNEDNPVSSTGVAGTINSQTWSLFGYRTGGSLFDGLFLGAVAVNESPNNPLWETSVLEWLYNNNINPVVPPDPPESLFLFTESGEEILLEDGSDMETEG